MLNEQHIQVVKSTIPLLESAGPAITAHFYQRMFEHNPELQNIFNMSNQKNGRQGVALFEAVAAYAKNIDDLAALSQAVERIAHKHTSFSIQAPQYAIVGHHLIETLRELAADAFTKEVEEAWTHAYEFLAGIFINREKELYEQSAQGLGGWNGARNFIVKEKTKESALVTSFVLEPEDGGVILEYSPGQYLGVELTPNTSDYTEIRQYSLSTKPNSKSYRISVKRELGEFGGIVSNYLHDHVNAGDAIKVHAPAGDFYFEDKQKPVVLISAGVGITPMQSMLEYLNDTQYKHPVLYLHACRNQEEHSFANRTSAIVKENNWSQTIWYESAEAAPEHIKIGFMNLSEVQLPIMDGDFYLCGPVAFMKFIKNQLIELGVGEERIHYEVFGPHSDF